LTELELTDTHCHLDFDAYQSDLDAVLERARQVGITRILTIGIDMPSSERAVHLAERYPEVYAAAGVHPNTVMDWTDRAAGRLERLLEHEKVVAVGEIGLDYYREYTSPQEQQARFAAQLEIAESADLPVIVHTRNAAKDDRACIRDVLRILTEWHGESQLAGGRDGRYGVLHSFSGNREEALQAYGLGFYTGFTGPVTFKNAKDLQKMVAELPLEKMLIETDGPFLTPHPHRGKRNEPAYVRLVAEKIALLKEIPVKDGAEITTNNARQLFGWS
jgi:TatD DNase family protein